MDTPQNIALKVCGMRDPNNIQELILLDPQYMGFIFYERSSRYVGEDFDEAITTAIPATIKKTGVFVNANYSTIKKKIDRYQLAAVQLHGDETPQLCSRLQELDIEVIKVFSVGAFFDFSFVEPYGECSDYFLFDTKGAARGGNGVPFDWDKLDFYTYEKPFFLSGGIGPESLEDLRRFSHPKLHAIDINSRFEISPGLKDISKIKQFKQAFNQNSVL